MRLYLLLGVLLFPYFVLADCETYNSPNLFLEERYNLSEDELFNLNLVSTNIPDRTDYTFNHINSTFVNFAINNGKISLTPKQEDVGLHKILIIGFADNYCVDSKLVTFKVYDKPNLTAFPESREVETKEGRGISFKAAFEDFDSDETHKIKWFLDEKLVSENLEFNYLPLYNESGIHKLRLTALDSRGLEDEVNWKVVVSNVNRPPILVKELPDMLMLMNTSFKVFDLNSYFIDPDGDKLSFYHDEVLAEYDNLIKIIDMKMDIDEGIVTASMPLDIGYNTFKYVAKDEESETESNAVRFQSMADISYTLSLFCGDNFCSKAENCNECPEDCGSCNENCEGDWECGDWGVCEVTGIQTRSCVDKNECGFEFEKPPEAKACEYIPTCSDRIKNQNETGVDCGGSCPECPTCNDGIKNQGEDKIDCGGPCGLCETCFDNIRNQNETDVDCGGPCNGCSTGGKCKINTDCFSLICEESFCSPATCNDNVKNQGEKLIDCGGPCIACPTCTDGIKNQDETDIDCGGFCGICPTCDDETQNQNEKLVDCGGPCEKCSFVDYIRNLEFKYFFLLILGVMLLVIIILKSWTNRDRYSRRSESLVFLERNKHANKVIRLNKIFRLFRFRKRKLDELNAAETALSKLDGQLTQESLRDALSSYLTAIGVLSDNYDDAYDSIKRNRIPRLVKILLILLLRKLWHVKSESMMLPEEISRRSREASRILKELKKDLS